MTRRFDGKVALITGGAFGMGAATARLMAEQGARVAIGDLLETEGQGVASDIQAAGGDALFIRLDVTSEADWKSAMGAITDAFGRLDILVNNAGISGSAYDDQGDVDAWDVLMRVNATGPYLGTQYASAEMIRNGGGAIVNISSISGIVGQGYIHPGYNASKGAVRAMTKQSADRLARHGIRVNSVHPGIMPPMRTSGVTADPEQRRKILERHVPMRRAGEVIEVAMAVAFLASDEASYITGAELPVDGGYLAI